MLVIKEEEKPISPLLQVKMDVLTTAFKRKTRDFLF